MMGIPRSNLELINPDVAQSFYQYIIATKDQNQNKKRHTDEQSDEINSEKYYLSRAYQ